MGCFRRLATTASLIVAVVMAPALADESREPLIIYDFENLSEIAPLKKDSENVTFDVVQDAGVTRGANCLRWVATMGDPWSTMEIRSPDKLTGYAGYDYYGVDVYNGMDHDIAISLEFWDADSTNYHTRCTLEGKLAHPGANRLFWRIDQLKRNNKEGRDWSELEAKDKIRLTELKKIKLIMVPAKEGGNTTLWVDNFRLLPESAVNQAMAITLPTGAIAYKFGSTAFNLKGFTAISLAENGSPVVPSGDQLIGAGVQEIGGDWPDNLTGNGLTCPGGELSFRAKVPTGDYQVWLSAGRLLDPQGISRPFIVEVGGKALVNETLSEREFFGEKGIFHYMRTQYSERPNALWLDYVEPEAQEFVTTVTVGDSGLNVRISNMRLSALVLVPAKDEVGFKAMCESIRSARITSFNSRTFIKKQVKPVKPAGAGAYSVWLPAAQEATRPWSDPAKAGTAMECRWSGAQGERIAQRICVTPWQDLGTGELSISDFSGPSPIPATQVRLYYMNYRFRDGSVTEMTLLPWTKIRFESGITWAYWAWLKIPDDAKPGTYTATATFTADTGGATKVPITLTVHPFTLAGNLPVSYGMYYDHWQYTPSVAPEGFKTPEDFIVAVTKDQFAFMREIGFTSVSLPSATCVNGELRTNAAQPFWTAAKEAGFGAIPEQPIMTTQLGLARRVGRELWNAVDEKKFGMAHIDRNPGAEFELPAFREAWTKVMKPYKAWLDQQGMPVAVEVVDEPREVPNPWNRRRDDVIRYADWLEELHFNTFVTFMGDANMGKDYTPIVDHIDISSVHAWANSAKVMQATREQKKTLWFYNVGMDRYSWGFYNWAHDSKGRWEWHFCFPDGGSVIGHPNPGVWYTPFTSQIGFANHAPYYDTKGGMTFRTEFFSVADGITDYAYIYSLEKAIAAHPGKAATVKKAQDLLTSIRKAIPAFADVTGMVSPDSGALVGKGLDTPLSAMTGAWRASIAELLSEFAAP